MGTEERVTAALGGLGSVLHRSRPFASSAFCGRALHTHKQEPKARPSEECEQDVSVVTLRSFRAAGSLDGGPADPI